MYDLICLPEFVFEHVLFAESFQHISFFVYQDSYSILFDYWNSNMNVTDCRESYMTMLDKRKILYDLVLTTSNHF